VFLAYKDPAVSGNPRPIDLEPEPRFDQYNDRYQRKGPWRCRMCYAKRFQTMNFKLVTGSPDQCPACNLPRKEVGYSLWIPYEDLPPSQQQRVKMRYAKKIEKVLWTKWPDASIKCLEDDAVLPSC